MAIKLGSIKRYKETGEEYITVSDLEVKVIKIRKVLVDNRPGREYSLKVLTDFLHPTGENSYIGRVLTVRRENDYTLRNAYRAVPVGYGIGDWRFVGGEE